MRFYILLVFLALTASGTTLAQSSSMKPPKVPKGVKLDTIHVHGFRPREAMQVIEHEGTNPVILDVRTKKEFATGHIKGAINIPIDQLERRLGELKKWTEQTIIAVCDNGQRAMQAAGILTANKFGWAFYLKTGLEGWKKDGLPLEM